MDNEFVFETRDKFREWLKEHGQTSDAIWLIFGKIKTLRTLSAEEALEEALCFGWIDGLINSIDEHKYKKYFARRRKDSNWSEKNKKLTEKLIKEKKMTEFGLQAIEEAKQSGEWNKKKENSISEVDRSEFETKLKAYDLAFKNYISMPPSTQKQFAGFYFEAKKEETRQKRLETIIGKLEQNKRLM